jgi:polyhydroxybutyrate depolymerase
MGSQHRLLARQAGLILAVALAAACSARGDHEVAATTTTTVACSDVGPGEARVDVGDRWYLRHEPPAHDGTTRVPLVVDLHGYSEGAERHAQVTGFETYGDDHGFVTITPNGGGDPPQWDLDPDGADVRFVGDVIDDAEQTLCIDPDRIYVTGHSMGAFLTSAVACRLADRVAAFAPVAGVRAVDGPCTDPSPALIIHATGDGIVLFDGGLSADAATILGLPADGPSVPALADAWAQRNGCTTAADGYECPPGLDVHLQVIDGGSHEWPRTATADIWSFFADHRRR